MIIRFEENVSTENAQLVCQWSNSLGKSFQEQWMGTMIPFPLTIQVLAKIGRNLFQSLKDKSLGLIQKNQARRQQSSYWTLFINPQKQGQGIG